MLCYDVNIPELLECGNITYVPVLANTEYNLEHGTNYCKRDQVS
jgi:hypothetical protein